MKLYIYSSYGVLECTPMTLQAIENSIPATATNQEEAEVASDSCCDFSEETPF